MNAEQATARGNQYQNNLKTTCREEKKTEPVYMPLMFFASPTRTRTGVRVSST